MNKLRLLVAIIFCIFAGFNLTACTGENYSTDLLAGGGGTETGNGIANKDSVVIRDSVVTRDSIIYVIDTLPKDTTPTGVSVSGVAQKGPFINGSPVYIFELSDEKLLQTGSVFHGKTSDNGKFKISNIALDSKYAILEATGYFMNEVTGKESTSPITLRAIADITDKESININFLTQLEYDRVVYLVLNEKKSLDEAKAQAQKEIIQTFFGKTTSENFEELDIFGDSEDDIKLLALSVLLLAENSEAKFSKVLSEIATDIETDGTYDAQDARASMADFAAFSFYAEDVRKVVEKLAGKKIGDFEKVIYDLWVENFGLGACNDKNEGEIKQNQNKHSAYSTTNFKCSEGSWTPYYLNPACDYGTFTDERDKQVYHTTTIGKQTWMAENLRYADKPYRCYNDNQAYCQKYGFYYTYENIECPTGYHIPSLDEWNELFNTVSNPNLAADSLRAIGGWSIKDHPGNAKDKDKFCFSVIPAGVYYYGDEGNTAYFHTSNCFYKEDGVTLRGTDNIVFTAGSSIAKKSMNYTVAIPVRCVKDAEK